ncbi:MAG: hypothetical protein ACKOTH_06930, partial [Solirubrobacterales bacterium]
VGNPGHVVRIEGRRPEGPDADWIHLPDPVADAIRELSERNADLDSRVARLAGEEAAPAFAGLWPAALRVLRDELGLALGGFDHVALLLPPGRAGGRPIRHGGSPPPRGRGCLARTRRQG